MTSCAEHLEPWDALCDSLARAVSDVPVFIAVDRMRHALIGEGLLTINAYDVAQSHLHRIWSSDPQTYPVGGIKYKADTPWTRQVLHCGELFVGEGDAVMTATFDDHEHIHALGLHAVVNVPLVWRQRCIGTFNMLRGLGRWTAQDITHLRLLAQLTVPAVALLGTNGKPGTNRFVPGS